MRPKTISKTGTGTTAWLPVDYRQTPFNASFKVDVTGTVTYTVEATYDNPFTTTSPVATAHPTVAAATTSQAGTYSNPIMAVRVNNTAGTGTTALTWIQSADK